MGFLSMRGKEFGLDNNIIKEIVKRLKERQKYINGTEFENLCYPIFEIEVRPKLAYHKGHNVKNKPVGYTVDFFTNDLRIAGQCGTNESDLNKKIDEDIGKSVNFIEDVKEVYVFVNNYYTGEKLKLLINDLKDKYQKEVKIYDSSKIAEKIYENPTEKVLENVRKYLGEDIFNVIEESKVISFLPYLEDGYKQREELEKNIIKNIENNSFLILQGISGIGKSTLVKKLAYSIKNKFDFVFWIDENTLINSINLTNININNKKVNLAYYIEHYKTLIIFDNLKNSQFIDEFLKLNSNNKSKLMVTTKVNFNKYKDFSINVPFLKDKEKKEFLNISNEKLQQIPGIPLILKVLIPYENDEDLDDLIDSIHNLKDEEKINYIYEKILYSIEDKELELFYIFKFLDNRFLLKDYIKFNKKMPILKNLENRFLINKYSDDFYEIHESIWLIMKKFLEEKKEIYELVQEELLLSYLCNKLNKEDIYFFIFIHFYTNKLIKIYNKTQNERLKKYLLYILVQSKWKNLGEWFLSEVDNLILTYEDKIDFYLLIEKWEIVFYLNRDSEDYKNILQNGIKEFEQLKEKTKDKEFLIDVKHHIGKTYYKLGKFDKNSYKIAYNIFKSIIDECKYCYKTKLQLFRILSQKKYENGKLLEELINDFIELSQNKSWNYLTVILDFYKDVFTSRFDEYQDLVASNEYLSDNLIKAFIQNIDQAYEVLKSIISKLRWNKNDMHYKSICSFINNFFSDIKINELKINQKKALLVILGECQNREKFYIIYNLINIKKDLNDYEKFQVVKILNNNFREFEQSIHLLNLIDLEAHNGKEFIYQQYAKAYLGLKKCKKALNYIIKALETENLKDYYKNAFEKDKSNIEDCLKNESK